MSAPQKIIFNASFSTGIVPDLLKIAKVNPVFKKGEQASLNNHRPVSIFSMYSWTVRKAIA